MGNTTNLLGDSPTAARAVILPLDWPADSLEQLFDREPRHALSDADSLEDYLQTAYTHFDTTSTPPTGAQEVSDIAVFNALSALRTLHADPLTDTKYENQEPAGSAEARMLQAPFRKHPGLTRFGRQIRRYYIATTAWLFDEAGQDLQAELAAVLLTPATDTAPTGIDSLTRGPYRAYAQTDVASVRQACADNVTITDDGVRLAAGDVSQWCQVRPLAEAWYPSPPDDLPRLPIHGDSVTVPWPVFYQKLAEYAWHGWFRLVTTAYNALTVNDCKQLVEHTPKATDYLYSVFKRNEPIYAPYYASESENPRRKWEDTPTVSTPLQIEDKRLITAVDAIRNSRLLSFDDQIPLDRLFTAIRTFFPPPRRPSNAVTTKTTLRNAIQNADSDQIKLHTDPDTNEELCELPQPRLTPLHPDTDDETISNGYLELRTARRRVTPAQHSTLKSGRRYHFIKPIVPDESDTDGSTGYNRDRNTTECTAARTQSLFSSLDAVEPFIPSDSIPRLTRDEVTFLTRIGLAMERQITTASLTTSMRSLRQRPDGSELNVDEEKLQRLNWLEPHDEGRGLLYTVPAEKRSQLNIKNVSNDGYGESTTSEKSLHRQGIDLCALWMAWIPEVTRVVRYCDLWRLQTTNCETALKNAGLLSTRIDVIGFNGAEPMHVAEVETASNDPGKSQRCLDKLAAFTNVDDVTTSLVAPNSKHLWTVMRHLDQPEYLNFEQFPDSDAETYGRSSWQKKLASEDVFDQFFTNLHTYRSLRNSTPSTENNSHPNRIVGHI